MTSQPNEQPYEYQARLRDGSQWRAGCLYAGDHVHVRLKLLEQLPPGAWIIHAQPVHQHRWDRLKAWVKAQPATQWIALASMVIALSTFGFSVYQGSAIRQHQRLSVIPWLGLSFYYNEEGSGWILDRSGAGPALLQTFEVFVDDIAQPNWLAAGAALRLPNPPMLQFSVPRSGTLLMPGAADKIFWIAPGPGAEALQREANRLAIVACYCSLYEQCWRITNRDGREEVRTCSPLSPIRFGEPPRPATVSGTPSTSIRPGP